MGERKKNQHFVPRLLLRGFSQDSRSIDLVHLKSGRRIAGASIGDQCARNSFYGDNNEVENAFAELESLFSQSLGDKSEAHFEALSVGEKFTILYFVHMQRGRTVGAAQQIASATEQFLNKLAESGPLRTAAESVPKPDGVDINLDQLRIRHRFPQFEALELATRTISLIEDLEVKFLISDRSTKFVLGDDPVVAYNQYAEKHPLFQHYEAITGLAHKGLQLFLPISPEICIALFDPSTYEYGSTRSRICRPSVRDVKVINNLQSLSARDCIYFGPLTKFDELERTVSERTHHRDGRASQVSFSRKQEHERGSSQLVRFTLPSPRLRHSFGFARVTDSNPYEGWRMATIPPRSMDWLNGKQPWNLGKTADEAEGTRRAMARASGPWTFDDDQR